jgi:hypothetical protein
MVQISKAELDRRMGMVVDPNSIPRHDGADQGVMQGAIRRGSEVLIEEQGHGKRGTEVYDQRELNGNNYFGSQTVISLNEAPPLIEKQDPRLREKALAEEAAAKAAAKLAALAPPPPAAPVAQAPVAAAPRPRSPEELLAAMGLGKKK